MRDRLIEQRQAIAHRTLGGAGDQRQRLGLERDAFLRGDAGQMRDQNAGRRRAADRSAGSATGW